MNTKEMTNLIEYINKAPDMYLEIQREMNRTERLLLDISHKLELQGDMLSTHKKLKLATFIYEIRKERRKYKDALAIIKPLADAMGESSNKKALNKIKQAVLDMQSEEYAQIDRVYKPREMTAEEWASI